MENILIGIVGEDRDCEEILVKGFKRFYPDKVILLTKEKYISKGKKITKNLEKFDIEIIIKEIVNNPNLEEVFMKIRDLNNIYKGNNLVINVDVDYMTSCLALSSSFVNGIAAIGILGKEVISYPIMKFSYYNAINEKKMELLKIISDEVEFNSMEDLAKKSKMSLPLIAYHLRGNKDSDGLVAMNLIETEKKESSVKIKLTELGKLIAKGYIDVKSCSTKKK
jgi:hypothetical protein